MPTYVYDFARGSRGQSDLLGGKGANLAEMASLGLPVPPGMPPEKASLKLLAPARAGGVLAGGALGWAAALGAGLGSGAALGGCGFLRQSHYQILHTRV